MLLIRLFSKKNALLFYFLIFSVAVFCQNNDYKIGNIDIYIKNGESFLNAKIIKIEPWGIVINDGLVIHHKVISKIKTNNTSLFEELSKNIDSLKVDNTGSTATIDFSNSLVRYKYIKTKVKTPYGFSVFAAALTSKYENFELGFLISPSFLPDYIFFQANSCFNLFNSSNEYYLCGGFLGGGFSINLGQSRFLLSLNYGIKTIQFPDEIEGHKKYDGLGNVDLLYTEIVFQHKIITDYLFVLASARYFSDNVEIDGKIDHFNFSIGFGVSL